MQLDPNCFEDSSLHFFVPKPEGRRELMYYPISLGYFDCKPSYGVQRNMFSSYLLIVMLTGALAWQTRSGRGVARPGQALLLDCNTPHTYNAQGRCSFTFVHFSGGQSAAIYEEIERTGGNMIHLPDPNELNETIGEMLSSMRSDRRLNEGQASAMIYGMLMKLLERSGASGEGGLGNPAVDRAIAYIQAHLAEPLSVEDMAASTGYSASYFSHLFTQDTGMSPYQFVVRSRVEHAQQLLMTTRQTVQEIAFQCGFNSAANFCYTFRRMTGVSPHAYRKRSL
ncbi:MAG: helix-turn-helix transcriptional regulator [Clostridia bacterium]|nr:helix-turn-helix transcriptional regulator [Clostridia bacterium]